MIMAEGGYTVEHANVNAKHLGVAQDRRRFIATAVRKGFQSHVKMAAKALGATVTCGADVLPGKTGEGCGTTRGTTSRLASAVLKIHTQRCDRTVGTSHALGRIRGGKGMKGISENVFHERRGFGYQMSIQVARAV